MNRESNDKSEVVKKRYANVKDASEYTSIPVKTLYEWSSVGKVPSIRLGRKLLFDLVDLDNFMSNMKRGYNQEENIVNKIVGGINSNGI